MAPVRVEVDFVFQRGNFFPYLSTRGNATLAPRRAVSTPGRVHRSVDMKEGHQDASFNGAR
jgi:hypothetical protein